jgi:hypothetical protein
MRGLLLIRLHSCWVEFLEALMGLSPCPVISTCVIHDAQPFESALRVAWSTVSDSAGMERRERAERPCHMCSTLTRETTVTLTLLLPAPPCSDTR